MNERLTHICFLKALRSAELKIRWNLQEKLKMYSNGYLAPTTTQSSQLFDRFISSIPDSQQNWTCINEADFAANFGI